MIPSCEKPLDQSARVWVTDPQAAAYLDLANATYGAMLSVLAQTFSITAPDEQRLLMRVSVELMEASAAVSSALARMPANPAYPGVNAGVTFAVPRNSAYRPLQGRARFLFLERTQELQANARRVLAGEAAEKAERRLAKAVGLLDGSVAVD